MQPDGFPIDPNDPHTEAHRLLGQFLEEAPRGLGYKLDLHLTNYASGRTILHANPELQGSCFLAADERYNWNHKRFNPGDGIGSIRSHALICFTEMTNTLLYMPLEFNRRDILLLVRGVAGPEFDRWWYYRIPRTLDFLERHIAVYGLSEELREDLVHWSNGIYPYRDKAGARKNAWRLDLLIGRAAPGQLERGEPWADAALNDLKTCEPLVRKRWQSILALAQEGNTSRPSPRWLKRMEMLIREIGEATFLSSVERWFKLAADQSVTVYNDRNAEILKGLVWASGYYGAKAPLEAITNLAIASFRKVPEKPALAFPLGNACISTLSALPATIGVVSLSYLQEHIHNRSVLKRITEAVEVAKQSASASL